MAPETPVSDTGPPSSGRSDVWMDIERWLDDIRLMKFHATSSGLRLPVPTIQKIAVLADMVESSRLGRNGQKENGGGQSIGNCAKLTLDLHGDLLAIVAPSTPRTLAATQHRRWKERIVRPSMITGLTIVAVVAVAGFIATAAVISRMGTEKPDVLNQMNWLAASVLGAVFYSLFSAYKYVVRRTFDPQYTAVYWIRVILGGVAGVILANFGKELGTAGPGVSLGPALLALLGGYSSEAVNRVLLRFTETLVTAVKGSSDAQVREKEKELAAVKAQNKEEQVRERKRVISNVEDALATAAAPPEVVKRVKNNLETIWSN
ncbi:MAG: hypothetical protein ABUR63_08355 [Verrucomicrobiota bacterium]